MLTNIESMSHAELERHLKVLQRSHAIARARENLLPFLKVTMPDPERYDDPTASAYRDAPHHHLLCEAFEKVASGENLRLAVSIPPQHGKTRTLTLGGAAWFMGKFPHKHMILGFYNQDFANENGALCREIMQTSGYKATFPGTTFQKGSKSKDNLITTRGGRMAFIGRGGSGTGKPADLIILDDPLKNAQEAESLTIRRELHSWYNKVIYSRVRATTAIIIIHTRWSEDDLIGRLCDPDHPEHDEKQAKAWTYLNVPAVLSPGPLAEALKADLKPSKEPEVVEAFGAGPIAALWPEEFPLRHLASAKALDPLGFGALYMGKPTPDDGYYFRKENIVEYDRGDLPEHLRFYGASDHAVSERQERDSTVIGTAGVDERDDIWIMPDLVWEQMETDRTVEEIIRAMREHEPELWWLENEMISKSFGPFLRKRMDEDKVYTPIYPVTPSKDKRTRARSIQGRMQQRKVHFPRYADWWPAAKSQLLKFPYGAHDDFVDFIAHIGNGLTQELRASRPSVANDDDKVIRLGSLKTGSPSWIRIMGDRRRREEERKRSLAGW